MRAYLEKDFNKQHIVVGGFMGSGHEELGRDIAERLRRGVLDTRSAPDTRYESIIREQWAAPTLEANEIAWRLEAQGLMPLCDPDLRPRVALLRAYPFVRRATRDLLKKIDAITVFVNAPEEQCQARVAPRDIVGQSRTIRMAASAGLRDLSQYGEVNSIAVGIADIVVPGSNPEGATPLEYALAALADLSLRESSSQPS